MTRGRLPALPLASSPHKTGHQAGAIFVDAKKTRATRFEPPAFVARTLTSDD